MWTASTRAINEHLADDAHGQLWYGHADMNTGKHTATDYGALSAFCPGLGRHASARCNKDTG